MRTDLRKIATMGLLATAFVLVLAACGGDEPTPTATTAPAATSTPTSTPSGPAPTPTSVPPTPTPIPPDQTELARQHFSGKTIRIMPGFNPGGGHDLVARVIARYLPEYIPGNPRVVIQNVPGAASAVAAETVARAEPDGLTLAVTANQFMDGALGKQFSVFDATKARVIGVGYDSTFNAPFSAIRAEVGTTFADIMARTDDPVTWGALAATAGSFWQYFKDQYNIPIQIVPGYGTTANILPALASGELEGTDLFFHTTIALGGLEEDLVDSSKISLVVDPTCSIWPRLGDFLEQGGWQRPPCWEDVLPLTDAEKAAVKLVSDNRASNVYVLHAGSDQVPEYVLAALREAFLAVANDERFKADMIANSAFPAAVPGEVVERNVLSIADAPEEVKEIIRIDRGLNLN